MADDDRTTPGGRRAYDPDERFIEERMRRLIAEGMTATRHAIREDLAVLQNEVGGLKLDNATAHGELRADVAACRSDIAAVTATTAKLGSRVADLDRHDVRDDAIAEMSARILKATFLLATLIVSLGAIIVSRVG